MQTGQWTTARTRKATPRAQAIVTPERGRPKTADTGNSFQALATETEEGNLTQNKVAQHIVRQHDINRVRSDSITSREATDSDTDSDDSIMDKDTDPKYDELMAQLELNEPGSTDAKRDKLNLAHVVRFREALGMVLGSIPSRRYDQGHSWLVDTQQTYDEKMGTPTSRPVMPTRPQEVATTSPSAVQKQYKRDLAHYLICEELRSAGLTIIEHKFPMSLEHKKTRHGLPHNLTLQDAFDHIEKRLKQGHNKATATIEIKHMIASRTYQHKDTTSCISFLKAMERDKQDIDIIGESTVTYTDLMMYCQQAFRNSLRKSTIRDIDSGWKKQCETLTKPHARLEVWLEFKEYYDRAFTEKDEDEILTNQGGKAKSATTSTLTDIQARLSDLETDTAQLDSALSTIHNTTLNQGYAPTVATNASSIPNMVGTNTDDTLTALTSIMSSPDMKELLATVMREEIRRAIPATKSTNTTHQKTPRQPRAGWDQWKHWCHTHGTNLTHTSKDCPKPRPGHQNAATKDNPMGGNTKKDHLWMKYCHPVTYRAHDSPHE